MDGTALYDVLHPDEGPEQDNGQMYWNDGWGDLLIVVEGEPRKSGACCFRRIRAHGIAALITIWPAAQPAPAKRFWFTPEEDPGAHRIRMGRPEPGKGIPSASSGRCLRIPASTILC